MSINLSDCKLTRARLDTQMGQIAIGWSKSLADISHGIHFSQMNKEHVHKVFPEVNALDVLIQRACLGDTAKILAVQEASDLGEKG